MLQARDIVESKERRLPNPPKKFGAEGRTANSDKVVNICGDYNDKTNEDGKCTWSAANNKNCRYQHSCRNCWNSKKQLFNHREIECRSKSGQPFLDNGGGP